MTGNRLERLLGHWAVEGRSERKEKERCSKGEIREKVKLPYFTILNRVKFTFTFINVKKFKNNQGHAYNRYVVSGYQ